MHLETSSHPYAPFQKARFARAANACLFGTLSLTLKPLILESSVRYPYWQSNTFGFMERRDSGNRKSGSPHTVLCPSERMSDSLTPCALRKSESTESCPAPSWVKQPESFRLSVMLLKNLAQSLFLCDGSFLTYFLLLASMILRKKYSSSG